MEKVYTVIGFAIIIAVVVFAFVLPTFQSSSMETACSKNASSFTNNYPSSISYLNQVNLGTGSTSNYNYSYHYNKSLNQCFVTISESVYSTKEGYLYDFYTLMNIDSGDTVGSAWDMSPFGNKILEGCSVGGIPCSSFSDYTNLIQPYMNN